MYSAGCLYCSAFFKRQTSAIYVNRHCGLCWCCALCCAGGQLCPVVACGAVLATDGTVLAAVICPDRLP